MAANRYPAATQGPYMQPPPNWPLLLQEVGLNSNDLYHQIIGAVTRGSEEAQLMWDDFTFTANSDYDPETDTTVIQLITKGMAPLDAIIWTNGQGRPGDLVIQTRNAEDNVKKPVGDIYSGFFSWYFSLFTQARAVGAGTPNFLTAVMGMGETWSGLIRDLSTADIDKFPKEWIKNVNLNSLGDKAKNRLALGCAGHRYLASLKYLRPEDFKKGSLQGQAFLTGLRNWTGNTVWWDLHPITKAGNVITVTGSLNKMIEDCLADCVTEDRLTTLVKAKILNHVPILQPTHSNWVNFALETLPPLTQRIF